MSPPCQCAGNCTSLEDIQRRHASYKHKLVSDMLDEIQRSIAAIEEEIVVVGTVVATAVGQVSRTYNKREQRAITTFYTSLIRNHLNFFGLYYCTISNRIKRLVDLKNERRGALPKRFTDDFIYGGLEKILLTFSGVIYWCYY